MPERVTSWRVRHSDFGTGYGSRPLGTQVPLSRPGGVAVAKGARSGRMLQVSSATYLARSARAVIECHSLLLGEQLGLPTVRTVLMVIPLALPRLWRAQNPAHLRGGRSLASKVGPLGPRPKWVAGRCKPRLIKVKSASTDHRRFSAGALARVLDMIRQLHRVGELVGPIAAAACSSAPAHS